MASGPSWLCPAFYLRARLDFSIPSCSPGQRGITPAFGYSAPHSSTEGPSITMTQALPSTHYKPFCPSVPHLGNGGLGRLSVRDQPGRGWRLHDTILASRQAYLGRRITTMRNCAGTGSSRSLLSADPRQLVRAAGAGLVLDVDDAGLNLLEEEGLLFIVIIRSAKLFRSPAEPVRSKEFRICVSRSMRASASALRALISATQCVYPTISGGLTATVRTRFQSIPSTSAINCAGFICTRFAFSRRFRYRLRARDPGQLNLQRGQEGRTGLCRRNHPANARSGLRIDQDGLLMGLCPG
ncbi:hypothetical protein ACVMB1_000256 [Bradyrhizobium sp. USDA 4504]